MVSRWEQEVGELGLNSEEFITFTWKMYEPSVKLQVKWHDRLDSMVRVVPIDWLQPVYGNNSEFRT